MQRAAAGRKAALGVHQGSPGCQQCQPAGDEEVLFLVLRADRRSGAPHIVIVIAPYDPTWPSRFEEEAERIRQVFGSQAIRIEHVGSTSVPGLAAKPVIDIQVSVASLGLRELCHACLSGLGYTHVPLGSFDLVYPFFQRPAKWPSTHHVHLCAAGSVQERDHLAFRDYLRFNPAAAAEYVALKRRLACSHDGLTVESQERYSLSKTPFVTSILTKVAFASPYDTNHIDAKPDGAAQTRALDSGR